LGCQYGFAGVLKQVFHARKFLLGFFFIPHKKELFFETAEKVFRNKRSQMSGNPV
jgi:hypothetical protein